MRVRLAALAACCASLTAVAAACGDVELVAPTDDPDVPSRPPLVAAPEVLRVDGAALQALPLDDFGPPYPIVLVHGFSGWDDIGPVEYFFGIKDDLLQARGEAVETPALPPYHAPGVRALVLAAHLDEILQRTRKAKVHVIGHSQGGLDAREAISTLGYGDRIATLTTVSTPHKGTPVADLAEIAPDGTLNAAGRLLGWLIGSLEGEAPDVAAPVADAWQPQMTAVMRALSVTGANEFNVQNQPDPRVAYFSVAGVSNLTPPSLIDVCADAPWGASDGVDPVDPFLLATGQLITSSDGILSWRANDGLVPVDSAVYGTFLGCFPADHFDEIGQVADVLPEPSGFSHQDMYRALVDHIRAHEAASDP